MDRPSPPPSSPPSPPPFLLLPGVLSAAECRRMRASVDASLGAPMDDAESLDNGDGTYARARVRDVPLARRLWARLRAHGPAASEYLASAGAVGLSHLWFHTRYPVGGDLHGHVDGTTTLDGQRSVLTLLVYLNDDFEGGGTAFAGPPAAEVVPRAGSAVLLRQDAWHEGRPVTRGTKYLLRGDVMAAA